MNIKQFQYVLALSREGSFSKAAYSLNITQPSLSQYIKKIEKEVGAPLFDRTNGEVRITDAGRVYIETAHQILDLKHKMENQISDITDNRAGSLIIGTAPYRAASMMPTVAKRFQKIYPGMHLVVREGTTIELLEGMENGEYDLAISLLPVNNHIFKWEKIVEEELILAVPSYYPVLKTTFIEHRKYPAVDARSLDGQSFVMLTETQYMQNQCTSLSSNYQITFRTSAIVKSLEAQIEMVKAGIGMALMPSGIERFCTDSTVTFYSFTEPLPKREVVVMWRKDRKLTKAAEELKKVICSIDW